MKCSRVTWMHCISLGDKPQAQRQNAPSHFMLRIVEGERTVQAREDGMLNESVGP